MHITSTPVLHWKVKEIDIGKINEIQFKDLIDNVYKINNNNNNIVRNGGKVFRLKDIGWMLQNLYVLELYLYIGNIRKHIKHSHKYV